MKKLLKFLLILLLLWLAYVVVCLVIPPLFHKSAETAAPDRETSAAQERVLSIGNNRDALLWRLRLIEAARERIVLTTFDFRDDNSGRDIMAALLHAADRGVEVRILVDGINGALQLTNSKNFRQLAAHEGVEVRLYNPINLLLPWKINYRMHDKYLIADDFAYILGGRNTDDLFLGNYVDTYNQDMDILVYETVPGEGGSYRRLQAYFDRIWALPCCKPYQDRGGGAGILEEHYRQVRETYPQAFTQTDWEAVTLGTDGVELCTGSMEPENKRPQLWSRLVEEMKRDTDVLIITPYIISSKQMYQDLTAVCLNASRVDMILNAVEIGSNPFGCTDYLNQKERVRETGVRIYEYAGEQALHTKMILIGDDVSIVGSCNFDMRSVYLDTEMMLVIHSPELNASLRAQAEALQAESRCVSPDGTVTAGEAYQPIEQGVGGKILYGVLRVLIIPFRHLL